MNLEQFHHGIRAAREVLLHEGASGALVIMGSQSILASYLAMVLGYRTISTARSVRNPSSMNRLDFT